ncbi:hypothetical protein BO70DRAFT_386894 [Aspergillus heteromorphus CBS 117.55]|uniref:Alpha/beta hydrolase fold-3 domain-containing protein n=1 Tax=Aspergillus heteromorphus CBS 117.55 TaxID=1448321 RepID=A0A317WAC4_9EURO|nr:uncharacterized protein BO70DRAFT_386894 [Aspergillus heteromorphus CBS 117.55]PWY83486.1 hypothetical protein BO70DRAFT_386894 [Aspergillus heteromorphus CBS 117.55]
MATLDEKTLRDLRPKTILQPLHNSIPPELLSRFDPVYVEHYNKYNAGRLHTHEVPIEKFRKDPAKYITNYGRAVGPDVFRITEQTFVDGLDGHLVAFDIDYRLAPEHKYPIPLDDCWTAFNWEFNVDPDRMAVGGCSAGGHLSAVIALLCRNASIPLRLQVLNVPVCDLLGAFTPDGRFDRANCPYDSYREMEFTTALPMARMAYFHRHFLGVPRPASSEEDWKISPIVAPDLSGLAPALVFTAEMDPLRDEGEQYAAKLKAAGCQVELLRMAGAPHTFSALDGILECGRVYNAKVIEAMQKELVR